MSSSGSFGSSGSSDEDESNYEDGSEEVSESQPKASQRLLYLDKATTNQMVPTRDRPPPKPLTDSQRAYLLRKYWGDVAYQEEEEPFEYRGDPKQKELKHDPRIASIMGTQGIMGTPAIHIGKRKQQWNPPIQREMMKTMNHKFSKRSPALIPYDISFLCATGPGHNPYGYEIRLY